MKIAAMAHPEQDFLADGIICGLYELGHEVYELPYIKHLHGEIDRGYRLDDGQPGLTAPPGYMSTPLPANEQPLARILDEWPYDLVILTSGRTHARQALNILMAERGLKPGSFPLVLCDGEDGPGIRWDLVEQFQPQIYFKRELLRSGTVSVREYWHGIPVMPMPFGAFVRSYPHVDDQQKNYDLFLAIGNTHPCRRKLVEIFRDFMGEFRTAIHTNIPVAGLTCGMLSWGEYITALAKSRITASIRGWGRDTLRTWESLSFATCVLWADPGIYIPHPFEDMKHVVQFREHCVNLPGIIRDLMAHPEVAEGVAAAGKAHVREFHTTSARVQYLLDVWHEHRDTGSIALESYGLQ